MNYPEIRLLIDGKWHDAVEKIPVINPADEGILGWIPKVSVTQLAQVVDAAARGFRVWRDVSPERRASIIREAARIMRERAEDVSRVATLEQGKPIGESLAETQRACGIIEWDAEEGRRLYGRVIPSERGMRNVVTREPIGVVAAFSPWNFPVNAPARKIAGALSSGCAVILKASEETPGSAFLLAQAFHDAGVPPGALSLIFGDPPEISSFLVSHPSVRLITLTGSTSVGQQVASLAGRHVKPTVMELGGHSPVIVCADTDPVVAASVALAGKRRNAGQVCVSPTRFFVEEPVYQQFVNELGRLAATTSVGNGLSPDTQMGPLANLRRVDAMRRLRDDALEKGSRLVSESHVPNSSGFYFPLTVLADVPDSALAMREEPFGPLALVSCVANLDAAIAKANSLPYGLAAYAFTDSARNILRLGDELECGTLSINHTTASFAETPFGGVKGSGYGREGGAEGIASYTVVKHVSYRPQ